MNLPSTQLHHTMCRPSHRCIYVRHMVAYVDHVGIVHREVQTVAAAQGTLCSLFLHNGQRGSPMSLFHALPPTRVLPLRWVSLHLFCLFSQCSPCSTRHFFTILTLRASLQPLTRSPSPPPASSTVCITTSCHRPSGCRGIFPTRRNNRKAAYLRRETPHPDGTTVAHTVPTA